MTLRSTIRAGIAYEQVGPGDFAANRETLAGLEDIALKSGTGDNQADVGWSDERTIAASSSEDLDLAGVLVNGLGVTATFVKVKAIAIEAAAANTNNVVVGAAATNPFTGPLAGTAPTVAVPPGGRLVLAAPKSGWAVGAAASDILKVANSGAGTGVTYRIAIIGTSA